MTAIKATGTRKSHSELIRLAQQGSPEAFAILFNSHKRKVYSICLRMTGNTAEAEDFTQDTFLQMFRKLSSFRGDSALSTWLYRLTVNTVLMRIRRKGLRRISLDEAINPPSPGECEHWKADDRLSALPDRIDLTRALKELPNGTRTVLVLYEIDGYDHHEIARLLRCSVGNSKSQLYRAKMRMRELLKANGVRQTGPAS